MLHLLHHVLEHRVGHIADEQVVLRVPVREQRLEKAGIRDQFPCPQFRGIRYPVKIRGFTYRPMQILGVLNTNDPDLGFHIPGFGVSHTEILGFHIPKAWIYAGF